MENIELSLCVITTFQISYVGDYHLYMTNFCLSSLQYPIALSFMNNLPPVTKEYPIHKTTFDLIHVNCSW